MKCPFCLNPLIIREYHEKWADFKPLEDNKYLLSDTDNCVLFDEYDDAEAHDYECASCKENINKLIGMEIKDLQDQYPEMFK